MVLLPQVFLSEASFKVIFFPVSGVSLGRASPPGSEEERHLEAGLQDLQVQALGICRTVQAGKLPSQPFY